MEKILMQLVAYFQPNIKNRTVRNFIIVDIYRKFILRKLRWGCFLIESAETIYLYIIFSILVLGIIKQTVLRRFGEWIIL